MYQGDGAEEEWRQDIAKHMALRHPNIIQICGVASSNGLHAAIVNDDLIPLRHFLDRYRESHFKMVYIYACFNQDFTEASNYLHSAFQRKFYSPDCKSWIRHSTGRLCAELTPTSDYLPLDALSPKSPVSSGEYSSSPGTETITMFIDSLTLERYHDICYWNLRQYRHFDIPASTAMNLGAIFHCSSYSLEGSFEIASLLSVESPPFTDWRTFEGSTGEVMPSRWTRFQSGDVTNSIIYLQFGMSTGWDTWLSQANHIFRRLNIMANFEDYVVMEWICFNLNILPTTGDSPEGFLFLCPKEYFQMGPSSFRWPACPAYWSLDPSGIVRLSSEEAKQLGFPRFQLTATAWEYSWDDSVYEGLRQFHEAKGFNPYSEEVARHLGLPLYQLSSERDAPGMSTVVHLATSLTNKQIQLDSDGEEFDADINSDCDSGYTGNDESEYEPISDCDDSDVDAESSHSEADAHDAAGENCESDPTEILNCANHNASQSTLEEDMVAEEIFVPSPTLRIVLYIELMLILFLALSGVHHHVW
ncbi:hypothetical protein MSAN_00124300 [Mycena sanguinolenta]|uniref:Uncharacterized protein n=1 Tax=Mycena sanguinolenta TaxID=230812 RepID=A0A8H6ZIR2_9AGAR|nr:hypothetical protein MSAN_00124300 [Mycena sanguinolenta]